MEKRAFVLLSGGLDSTTCLYKAIQDMDYYVNQVEAVSIDYGQRHIKEAECAAEICQSQGIKHSIINIQGIVNGAHVMLTNPDIAVPDISYDEIQGISPTYVPFRNGTMLAVLAAHAQKYVMAQVDAEVEELERQLFTSERGIPEKEEAIRRAKDLCTIYFGAHAEDANNWAYPDCTPEFVGAMANAIYIGTYFTVRLVAPFLNSMKADIVNTGIIMSVPFEKTWSCYKGEDLHCGTCPTCLSRRKAFADSKNSWFTDPTVYACNQVDTPPAAPMQSDPGDENQIPF